MVLCPSLDWEQSDSKHKMDIMQGVRRRGKQTCCSAGVRRTRKVKSGSNCEKVNAEAYKGIKDKRKSFQ